jgi:carbon monoxide dehydrogenase subunit G
MGMTVTAEVDLEYEFAVKAKAAEVFSLLSDVPESASFFPKVDRVTDLGKGVYQWEMQKVGTPQVNIQTVYASKYKSDAKKRTVGWTPVKGSGNAQVAGSWAITDRKTSTALKLVVQASVFVPLPDIMQAIVQPVVSAEFEKLLDQYIANLIDRFGGEVE